MKFPFPQLMLEYGLLNTFLLRNDKFDGNIYLLFDKEKFTRNLNITNSKYFSLCELLIDCENYNSIELYNDYIVVGLKIPQEYHQDIQAILRGSYSKVSNNYKNEIYFRRRMTHIPEGDNKFGMYIVGRDLAYGIAIRDVGLRDELKDLLDYDKPLSEYYPALDSSKENFTPKVISTSKELIKI
jgi:hypothetical protein